MSLRVVSLVGSALIQDEGRPGLSALGVGPSGAYDRAALRQANALLGNTPGDAVIEIVGALTVQATRTTHVAVTGAPGGVRIDGDPCATGRPVLLPPGGVLHIDPATIGVRRTLAVRGGVQVDPVLGSRSRDVLAALGPEPLREGDVIASGPGHRDPALNEAIPLMSAMGDLVLRVVLGPRDDWFSADAVERVLSTGWTVSPLSDRIGVRLDGPPVERANSAELESEPVVRGSIQVTSSGQPVVLGPDHPVTGGYPVIAVVIDADLDLLAHAAPGRVVRLTRHRL